MKEFPNKIPCRDTQFSELYNLLGEGDEPLPHSIFLSGNSSSGKTLCLETVLNDLGYKYVVVNCVECYTPKIMYETIVNELYNDLNCYESLSPKCENARDFINNLRLLSTKIEYYKPFVIVFDKAERLRAQDHNVISVFVRLKEFTELNICSVLVTHLVYENFNVKMHMREPLKVYFPNYNKEDLFNIIFVNQQAFSRYIIDKYNVDAKTQWQLQQPELFANFLNAFLSVFFRPCRDLIELKHMARVNFVKYCEPIVKNEIEADDLPKLWRHISPILKTSLELLYLRLNTTENTESSGVNVEKTLKNELLSTKIFAQSFELPYYAKYLLIAAYLASYNPPKEDKRLFMKYHGKQKKRLQQVKAKAKISDKLNTQLGPKSFTLDRLLAIFYAILEEKIGLTSNLLSQIQSLVELKLLSGAKEIDLDNSKYKCVVGYEFISAVASTVGFNVRKYLYDFM